MISVTLYYMLLILKVPSKYKKVNINNLNTGMNFEHSDDSARNKQVVIFSFCYQLIEYNFNIPYWCKVYYVFIFKKFLNILKFYFEFFMFYII